MHYLINGWLEEGDILTNYTPWYGLDAYRRGVTDKLFLVKKGKN